MYLDFEKYKEKSPPIKPIQPQLREPTVEAARQLVFELEQYEEALVRYLKQKEDYKMEQWQRMARFREDCIAEAGLTKHPKADKAFNLAWDRGHANGLEAIASELEELADLLND